MNLHLERGAVADSLETIADTLVAAGHHREADEVHALADDLRTERRGPWEAVFEHDDGRYLHLGYGPDEPTVQARATAWALSFGGRLDWHDPWPDGTRQADFIAPDQDPGTGIEVRPADRHDRRHRFNEHQRGLVIRLRNERDEAQGRLTRIGNGHSKHLTERGMTSGDCNECGHPWPCPTNTWATTKRDLGLGWDPFDDEPDEPPTVQPEPDEYTVTVQRMDGHRVGSIPTLRHVANLRDAEETAAGRPTGHDADARLDAIARLANALEDHLPGDTWHLANGIKRIAEGTATPTEINAELPN